MGAEVLPSPVHFCLLNAQAGYFVVQLCCIGRRQKQVRFEVIGTEERPWVLLSALLKKKRFQWEKNILQTLDDAETFMSGC